MRSFDGIERINVLPNGVPRRENRRGEMRIAVYVRVSTQRQAQTQTIEQQLEMIRDHSQAQGWPWQEEHIFRDDGYSGASLRRPGLDRLREQVSRADFDRVIITAPDRLARKYVHQILLIEELERGGCEVEFVDRPMSHDPHDQLLLQIRGAVSEYERSLIAERMRRGRRQKYQAGCLLPWTCSPYGYRVDPTSPRDPAGVRLEPVEAATVTELFAQYLQEGQTIGGVTKQVMGLQIPTPHGHWRWNRATIRGILTNPVYSGTVYLGRSRPTPARQRHSPLVPIGPGQGGHQPTAPQEWIAVAQVPAIVSQEQFDLVQAKLAHNQQFARRNNTAYPYLLRALVSCGRCHLACVGRSSRGGYAYYVCQGRDHPVVSHRDEHCSARYIPVKQLDTFVWQDVCEVLTHPEHIAAALQRAQGGQWLPQELRARRENLRKARVSVEHQIERLTDAYLANVLQLEEYKRRHQELGQRLQSIAEQARQLEASVGRHDELAALVQSMEAFCQRIQQGLAEATFEQKRQIIELLVDRVVVTEDEVEIRYVIPTASSAEQIRFCYLRLDYFDRPVLTIQFQQTSGIRLFGGEAGDAIDDLLGARESMFHPPSYTEDLPDSRPIACQKVIQFGRCPQETVFQTSMTFVAGAGGAPIEAVKRRFLKEEGHIFRKGRLIVLDGEQVVASCGENLLAEMAMRKKSIGTYDAPLK